MSAEQHDADVAGQKLARHHQHEATTARITVFQALAATEPMLVPYPQLAPSQPE